MLIVVTNINCSIDCIYQKDGKCKLESVTAMPVTPDSRCAYYKKQQTKDKTK